MASDLTFLGDVYLPKSVRVDVPDLDLIVFNLEYPITGSNKGIESKVNLKAEHNHILETFKKPPLAVCLANNHIMDYQEEGLTDTLHSLEQIGVSYYGAGDRQNSCNNPLLIEVDGIKAALLGYACPSTSAVLVNKDRAGAAPIDMVSICLNIQEAKNKGADKVIVTVHWGAEQVYLPKTADVVMARSIIDAGADLVIGHHSHCIQPYEVYKGKYIFYGLGNCIFPDIDVPSLFQEGVPTSRFIYKQRSWNKTSLRVRYNLATDEVSVFKLHFDGNQLTSLSENCAKYAINIESVERFQQRFKRSFYYGKLKVITSNYIQQPKWPKVKHIKSLISLSKVKQYK